MAIGKVIGRVAIKVLPDTTEFREKTANDLRRIEKQLGDIEVDVIPDIDKAAKTKVQNELKSWAKGLDLKVKVDLGLNDGDVAKSVAVLEALTKKRNVKIAPELDNGAVARVASGLAAMSGLRYTSNLFRKFRMELMSLDQAVPKIGAVSHAVATLGAWVLGVSGNLFSLSASIASIGKAGLALPGIFAGIAIGLATTIAALKDFNKQVPQAARYVRELQDTISQNFWEQAAAPIRNLVDQLFPILNKKLAETSTALGTFFGNFANSTIEGLLPSLPAMFDHLTESIQIASGFTDAFVGIIEKLGTVGSAYLPRLAQYVGDIATQFDNWLAKTGTDGLTKMIDQGIEAMKDFGSVIASTFSIFGSLAKAAEAAGGTTLSSLAESLRNVADAAQSPGFQTGLTATLKAAYDMLAQIRSIAGPALKELVVAMSQNFQKVAPIIGDTVGTALDAIAGALAQPAVAEGLEAMFQGFNDMVHTLAPTMDIVAEKAAVMGKLIGSLARNIGTVMAAAIVTLKPLFIGLVEAMIPIVDMLGPLMAQVITALGPVFSILGEALARAATAAKPMFDAIQKLVNLLLPVLVPVLKVVATIIGDSIVAVIQGATWVIEGLVKVVQGVINVFKGFANIIAGLFTLDFGRMWDGLKQVFSGLGQILLGGLQAALGAVWAYLNGTVLGFFKSFATKLIGPLAGPLGKIFKPLEEAATKVWGFLKTVWGKITGLFKGGGGGGGIEQAITEPFLHGVAVIRGALDVIKTIITTAWNVIKTVFSAGARVIGTVVRTAFKVIETIISTSIAVLKTIISTAWNVIEAVFSGAFTAIKSVVSGGMGAIKTFISDAVSGLYFLFKGPWDAISKFLFETFAFIKSSVMLVWTEIRVFFETLLDYFIVRFQLAWEAIRTAISTVMNAIKTVVLLIWDAIGTGIRTYLDLIAAVVKTVWNAIKSVITTVVKAIETVIKTVWKAIETTVTTVVKAIETVIKTVWNAIKSTTSSVFNSIRSTVSTVWNAIMGVISGVLTTIKNTVSRALGTVKSTMSSAWNSIKSTVSTAWNKVGSTVREGVNKVVSTVKELPGKAVSALAGIGTALINAGSQLIGGFIKGITDKFGDVKNKLGELTGKLTSWKGPESLDKVLLVEAGHLIIEGLIKGFEDKFSSVRLMLTNLTADIAGFIGKSMSQEISDALSFAMTGAVGAQIQADATVAGVNFDRRLGGLERQVTTAARSTSSATSAESKGDVSIGNITIPLEDLAQLKDLEEFLEMLRVRTRQG